MTTQELIDLLGLQALSTFENREVNGVFISDMLSDVMAGAKSGNLWITVQTHKNIVPAANLVDVSAVVITGGKTVPQETIELANKHNIAILLSEAPTFELVGRLYSLGLATK
jgi:predicted transcriptional regulator